jgi:hypothetical protein
MAGAGEWQALEKSRHWRNVGPEFQRAILSHGIQFSTVKTEQGAECHPDFDYDPSTLPPRRGSIIGVLPATGFIQNEQRSQSSSIDQVSGTREGEGNEL